MHTPFTRDNYELYNRDLNMMKYYIDDGARYNSIIHDKDFDECRQEIIQGLKDKRIPYVDPKVMYLGRDGQDREVRYSTMSKLLKEIEDNDFILSPTITAYTHPKEKISVSSFYIESELAKRSANKALKSKYDNEGNMLLKSIYDNRQNRNKIKCNSLSGAQGTTSSVLFLKSAHSSLTATCRSATSNTNANIERLFSGNRHYWSVNTAINNIVSVINCCDRELAQKVIEENNLVYPTAEYMIAAIKRCTDLYFDDPHQFKYIEQLVNKLSPLERAVWTYTGDLYNLANLNPSYVKDLLTGLSELRLHENDDLPSKEEAEQFISQMGGDEFGLIGIVADPILKSKKLKTVDKDSEDYLKIGRFARSIFITMREYSEYFDAFLINRSICPSMALFPESIRSIVVASDTDSCIFTNQSWVEWYNGKVDDSDRSKAVSAAITYIGSLYTIHVLAIMSSNLGVPKERLRSLQMKNEYAYNFFALTTMAKHYFASQNAVEGNIYVKPNWEVKGVTLKNTNAPKEIQQKSNALIRYLGTELVKDNDHLFRDILQEVANIEHEVLKNISKGNPDYFGVTKIHDQKTYKKPARWNKPNWGNHRHHVIWETCFADKYIPAPAPTYRAVKIKTTITSPTSWKRFIEGVEDKTIATKLDEYQKIYDTPVKTFNLPIDSVIQCGIPLELMPIMDIRDMVAKIMKSFYLILESLGFFMLNSKLSRLLSDDIEYLPNKKSILTEYL